jgi:uncharacterized protein (TIGR02757 family)
MSRRGAGRTRGASGAREARLKKTLDALCARQDLREHARRVDPVSFVHRFRRLEDRELAGLLASSAAFGNVRAILGKLDDLFYRLGDDLAGVADDEADVMRRLRGWKHRVFRGEDLARLLVGARRVQREHRSLGAFFEELLRREPTLREALACFCDAIRDAGGLRPHPKRRGPAHLLPNVRGGGGSKRLLLYLRWMARPADGLDLGLWNVPPGALKVPVDVHIHKLARNLGLTRRKDASWRTSEEITAALRRFDPEDPVRYDFSLCHMGMLQRCPSRRDPKRCEGCPVKPVCRHWAR